jgi:hypothetical protein
MAIWQALVDDHQVPFAYASLKRFVLKLRGSPSSEACAVITTVPGEDDGESRVMLSNDPSINELCRRVVAYDNHREDIGRRNSRPARARTSGRTSTRAADVGREGSPAAWVTA